MIPEVRLTAGGWIEIEDAGGMVVLDADEAEQVGRSLLVAADDARQRILALGDTTS